MRRYHVRRNICHTRWCRAHFAITICSVDQHAILTCSLTFTINPTCVSYAFDGTDDAKRQTIWHNKVKIRSRTESTVAITTRSVDPRAVLTCKLTFTTNRAWVRYAWDGTNRACRTGTNNGFDIVQTVCESAVSGVGVCAVYHDNIWAKRP